MSEELLTGLRWCEFALRQGWLPADVVAPSTSGHELHAERIAWVEDEIGATLPDELLSLLAIDHPVARLVTGLHGLATILDVSEEQVDEDLLTVSTAYSEPFGEILIQAHGGPQRVFAVPPGSGEAPLPVTVFEDGRRIDVRPLGAWLEDIVREEIGVLDLWEGPLPASTPHRDYQPPTPRIVAAPLPPPKDTEPRRVRHPKFGLGSVTEVQGEGEDARFTVRFEDGSTKKLLGRFLEQL